MSEGTHLIGKQYQDLYSGYYAHGAILKRELSAAQTVGCLMSAIGDQLMPRRLLDVGAGDGNVLAQLNAREIPADLYAVEVSASGVEAIKAKRLGLLRDVRLFDGYEIPYPDKYFDLAMAVHVLEHVEHERLFLREIRRVARYAYIEVPLEHGFRIQRAINVGKQFGHINFYTRETLTSLIISSGFDVMQCRVVASSLKYEQHLSGRVRGWMKNTIRRSALAIAPTLAPRLMVYNAYAYCDCK
jgi:ubiquinone/menaquinone biosynthesis C-methylase UbiE